MTFIKLLSKSPFIIPVCVAMSCYAGALKDILLSSSNPMTFKQVHGRHHPTSTWVDTVVFTACILAPDSS